MAAPELQNYEYQYGDNGVLFNGPDTVLPFWDVTGIQGLDSPEADASIQNKDSGHGAYAYAPFTGARTIIIDGTLYAPIDEIEIAHDLASGNYWPDDIDRPFYFKHPGVNQRYIMGKPLTYKSPIDTGRRTGTAPFQAQVLCSDTRKYEDNDDAVQTIGSSVVVTNNGFYYSWPILRITGSGVTVTEFENITANEKLTLQDGLSVPSGSELIIDTARKSIRLDGVSLGTKRAPGSKWPALHKGDNTFIVRASGATAVQYTLETRSAWG
jgi:hypothetical protein